MPHTSHGRTPCGFLIRPENRAAAEAVHAVTQAALRERPSPFCPLLLHGQPGTGKSHLLSAAVKSLASPSSPLAVRCASAAELARPDDSLGFDDDPALLTCDVLIIEDVQHLPARVADAVCDLIDHRASRRQALVLSSTVGPAGMTHMPRRLTSRLAAGLVVQLEPYGPMSRQEILIEAAAGLRVRLTPDALAWLTRQGGVRTAIGLVRTLAPFSAGRIEPLDQPDVERILSGAGQPAATGEDARHIVRRVANAFGVSEKELLGPSRLRTVLFPRQIAMYLTRELTTLSLPRIGSVFANRDHTTVLHACRKVEEALAGNDSLGALMRQMKQELS